MARKKGPRKSYLKRFSASMVRDRQRYSTVWLDNSRERAEELQTGEYQQLNADGFPVAERWHGGPSPRKTVLAKLDENTLMQSLRQQRFQGFNHVVLLKTRKQEQRLYFSGSEYILVEINHFVGTVRRSIVYSAKEKVLRNEKMGTIIWVESGKL